jgi:hypothetical protein
VGCGGESWLRVVINPGTNGNRPTAAKSGKAGASLYVLGARQRKTVIRREEEWRLYESALILEVDPESGLVETRVDYKSPPDARATQNSSNIFKSGTLVGNRLYTCTSTEVLVFELPEFRIVNYLSLPCFNDLHHVVPDAEGNLIITSTGLDMVVKAAPDGTVLEHWNVLGEDPWARFSRAIDYRKVDSTKPHKSHPNFTFELDGKPWVTRLNQRDAVCLEDRSKRIEIAANPPHDGLVRGDYIYFTTVDGTVVKVDRHTLSAKETIDLKLIDGQKALLGWCRGLMPVDDTHFWVGFTRVRKTNLRENVLWVRNIFREGMTEKPTHLTLYDIVEKKCLREFDLEAHGMNVVFSVFAAVSNPVESETLLVSSAGPTKS